MELIKRRGTLVVVSAPSGAGKTTLCHEVRSLVPDLYYSVSCTTRAPRNGEVNGTDFHFIDAGEFIAMRDRNEFAEWAQVHGHYYGTPARALEGALARGLDILLDIDTSGARQLRARYPEAVSVFIMAPSMAELDARLRERKSDAAGEIARRMSRAREEIAAWREYDYLIINRDVKEAVDQLATHHPGRALPHEPSHHPIPRRGGSRLMTFPSLERSLDKVSNRYLLVVLAAKRARQLNRGAQAQLESKHKKPTSVSLEEIADAKVGYRLKDEDAPKD